MKRAFFLPCALMVFVLATLFLSCRKENTMMMPPDAPEPGMNRANGYTTNGETRHQINMKNLKFGSIAGSVSPAEAMPRIFLEGTTSTELPVGVDGTIINNVVIAGTYSIYIVPSNPVYVDQYIGQVVVPANSVINLGQIILDYNSGSGGDGCGVGWGRSAGK